MTVFKRLRIALEPVEAEIIRAMLSSTRGDVGRASLALGLGQDPSVLYRYMKKHGISRPHRAWGRRRQEVAAGRTPGPHD